MRSYWPLRIILLLFIAPVLASIYLLMRGDHLNFNTVQHGTFIQPAQQLSFKTLYNLDGTKVYPGPIARKWHVIYINPHNCDKDCQAQKQILAKVHAALGANRDRVIMNSATSNMLNHSVKDGSMLIIDPLGFYIMHYGPESQPKYLVKDLKRLLKYSHV